MFKLIARSTQVSLYLSWNKFQKLMFKIHFPKGKISLTPRKLWSRFMLILFNQKFKRIQLLKQINKSNLKHRFWNNQTYKMEKTNENRELREKKEQIRRNNPYIANKIKLVFRKEICLFFPILNQKANNLLDFHKRKSKIRKNKFVMFNRTMIRLFDRNRRIWRSQFR